MPALVCDEAHRRKQRVDSRCKVSGESRSVRGLPWLESAPGGDHRPLVLREITQEGKNESVAFDDRVGVDARAGRHPGSLRAAERPDPLPSGWRSASDTVTVRAYARRTSAVGICLS